MLYRLSYPGHPFLDKHSHLLGSFSSPLPNYLVQNHSCSTDWATWAKLFLTNTLIYLDHLALHFQIVLYKIPRALPTELPGQIFFGQTPSFTYVNDVYSGKTVRPLKSAVTVVSHTLSGDKVSPKKGGHFLWASAYSPEPPQSSGVLHLVLCDSF